jgi:hypothetical protein
MCKLYLFVLALLLALPVQAQFTSTLDQKSTKGTFYVSVDDAAIIYVNGKETFKAGWGESRSTELELKTGDRIVVQLREDGGGRRFMLVFASTDGQTIVSFKNHDFKIVPDIGVTDFTPEQFKAWTKYAKQEKHKNVLPIKNYSEWIWGDLDKCSIASVVTLQMFAKRPQ